MFSDILSKELAKRSLAQDLLKLMFPNDYSDDWNVVVTEDGIFYSDETNENAYDRIDIRKSAQERYRHKKRNTHYNKQAVGTLQIEPGVVLKDGDQLVVYVGEEDGGRCWLRTPEEFHDGRFEFVPSEEVKESILPKGSHLERIISELRNQTKHNSAATSYIKSDQKDSSSFSLLKMLDRVEQAASLDGLVKYDTKNVSPKEIRRLKLNAMWATHRSFLNPFVVVEGDIPKERKDLVNYYSMFLDACDTIDNFHVFDKSLVQNNYPDDVFDKMTGQVDYVLKRHDNLDLGEDLKTLIENCVVGILRYASNFSEKDNTNVTFTAKVGRRKHISKIDSIGELLRLINGGAAIEDIEIG